MPKSLVLGNGNILLCFDRCGQVRDFYYHYVGLENHVGHGCVHRIGLLVDGFFSWLDSPDWQVDINYQPGTMASDVTAVNDKLSVRLDFVDIVYNEKNIFLRQATIQDLRPAGHGEDRRRFKIFFHQQFRIYDTSRRDTAYYDPEEKILVHYEGRRVFVIGARAGEAAFDEYSIGNYGIEGKEGTWKDAEDGRLEKNPIEHGAVDSVLAFSFDLTAGNRKFVDYWITVEKTIEKAIKLHEYVLTKKPGHLKETTCDFWQAWLDRGLADFADLSEAVVDLYRKSLLLVRTHTGNQGEIIASADSDMLQYGKDTYAYVWPRDAAFVALSLDKAGYSYLTRHFYEFCEEVISEDGYFYHKYRCDRSVGSSWHPWSFQDKKRLAIQEDETALILYGLWQHYQANQDLEYIEKIYNSLIKKAAEFLYHYRDKKTGLPKGSYDLWEQDFSTSTFTCCTVYGGLVAASHFANLLGKEEDSQKYRQTANQIKDKILEYLYDKDSHYFYKAVEIQRGKLKYDTRIDISSFYGVFYFGVLDINDPRLSAAYEVVLKQLVCPTPVGGVMRYVGDQFHQVSVNAPANPWFITTFWKAQYEIQRAQSPDELAKVKDVFQWALDHASPAGVMSEQLLSDSGQPVSAAPLTWSQAELVTTVLEYVKKYKQF